MSFSAQIKKELSNHDNRGKRHCDIAEMTAIINTCGDICITDKMWQVKVQTENPIVAKKYFKLVKTTFNVNCQVSIRRNLQFNKHRVYSVTLTDAAASEKLLLATGIMTREADKLMVAKGVSPLVVKSTCCKRAYVRGAFLSGGSQSNPEKSYHAEFINTEKQLSQSLCDILHFFGLNGKIILRKGYYVVYLKEGENIVDLLNIMEAHVSLMHLENVRIVKNMRNTVNRKMNYEMANLSKTVASSFQQVEDIQFITQTRGWGFLTQPQVDVAKLRLAHPEASLKEIGEMLSPMVGKSGVNHRLRKISLIAENLRGGTQ